MEFKGRSTFNKLCTINIWRAFFFDLFYYLAVGMWKKGLVLLAGLVLFGGIFGSISYDILGAPQSRALDTGLGVGLSWAVSVMATYDLYRFKVKKENFWW